MRKIHYLLIFILLVAVKPSNSQRIMGAATVGINLSKVNGDELDGYNKIGLNTGLAAIIPIGNKWSISIETIYTQKGSRQKIKYLPDSNSIADGYYKLKLDYLEIPLIVSYNDKDIFTLGAGFSYGKIFNVEEIERRAQYLKRLNRPPASFTNKTYNNGDLNLIFDLRFNIYKRLKGNIRYAHSLLKIATRDEIDSKTNAYIVRNHYSSLFTVRFYYIFNEKLSEKARKNIN